VMTWIATNTIPTKNRIQDIWTATADTPARFSTRHTAVQSNSDIETEETGESVTLGRSRKRKR
jgi:hypothetical protein